MGFFSSPHDRAIQEKKGQRDPKGIAKQATKEKSNQKDTGKGLGKRATK